MTKSLLLQQFICCFSKNRHLTEKVKKFWLSKRLLYSFYFEWIFSHTLAFLHKRWEVYGVEDIDVSFDCQQCHHEHSIFVWLAGEDHLNMLASDQTEYDQRMGSQNVRKLHVKIVFNLVNVFSFPTKKKIWITIYWFCGVDEVFFQNSNITSSETAFVQ